MHLAAFAINSTRQSTTRFIPFELLYGLSPALPIDFALPSMFHAPEILIERAAKLQAWREGACQLI